MSERTVKFKVWVELFGERMEKKFTATSPPISNQPCKHLQREADEALIRMILAKELSRGFEVIG